MSNFSYSIRREAASDAVDIDAMTSTIFGPAMFARAAYALREGVEAEMDLSFVAEQDDSLIGSVRLTRVLWGSEEVLMLGPLGVLPAYKGKGVGGALMQAAVDAARTQQWPAIILVGDEAYYRPFGFKPVPPQRISLPRPADPRRILMCSIDDKISGALTGAVTKAR